MDMNTCDFMDNKKDFCYNHLKEKLEFIFVYRLNLSCHYMTVY